MAHSFGTEGEEEKRMVIFKKVRGNVVFAGSVGEISFVVSVLGISSFR